MDTINLVFGTLIKKVNQELYSALENVKELASGVTDETERSIILEAISEFQEEMIAVLVTPILESIQENMNMLSGILSDQMKMPVEITYVSPDNAEINIAGRKISLKETKTVGMSGLISKIEKKLKLVGKEAETEKISQELVKIYIQFIEKMADAYVNAIRTVTKAKK